MIMLNAKEDVHFENKLYRDELLANIDDALIATDADFRITNWNKAAERIYGITAQEAIGRMRDEVLNYEYISNSLVQIYYELKTIGKWKGILKFTPENGAEVYLQSSSTAVKNDLNEIIGYVAINRDVTSQYLAEQSLEHFTAIMHSLQASFLVVDRKMKVVFLSPKKRVIEFHNSDYKVGDDALLYIPVSNRKEVTANYERAFAGETICHEANSGGDEKTRIYLEITYLPIINSYQHITHVAIIAKDLTDEKRLAAIEHKQKEMEVQLYRSRELFENFMQNCPVPAWVTDEDGVMQFMNDVYLKVTSFKRKDIGKNIYELFPKENADLYKANNTEVLRNKSIIEVIEQAPDSENNIRTYHNVKFPLYFDEKMMVAGWALDITAQKEREEKLEEANSFKTKLLSVISHDLRSPLTATSALTSMVDGEEESFTKEDLLEFMGLIRTGNQKTLLLLDELSQWAQSKSNKLHYEPNEISIAEIIYNSVDFLHNSLTGKGMQVEYDLLPDATAFADVDMVKTIIRNLVSNAIKFSPQGSTITVSSRLVENELMISVSDEGEGINEEVKELILKGKNSFSTYGTNGEKGIGLGLTICKDFIDLNKGKMMIQNRESKGCIFSFTLPVQMSLAE